MNPSGSRAFREIFAYSPHRLHEVFPCRIHRDAQAAAALSRGEESVAEAIYGNHRSRGSKHPDNDTLRARREATWRERLADRQRGPR